jgi:class 3 adenylate cyclase/predicted ATPase
VSDVQTGQLVATERLSRYAMLDAVMDVGGWLRGLGLGQYEANFRDNKINADLLPRLTNDDLKDIGVSALGDRLQLLDAIAALVRAKRPADVSASPSKSAPPKGSEVSAERRPITVMFCDLVGSTSLAAKLDAEDWRALVNTYLDEASAAVTGLGGHVLKRLGDGLMALFGYPQAQENDAERAVRAALAIQRALAEINVKNRGKGAPELLARIGIESGPVVVEATGEVFGDAPNIAARVQAAAEPGSVLVTLNVQRQVVGLFVAEEQGARELKGVSEPVQLFRIARASGGGRRGSARTLTPFVGREEELALLARRRDSVRAGEGQLVLIVGEPGLGKSRLIEEFHARLAETPHTWVEWSASQLLQNTPLHPIAEWGRLRFGADAHVEQRLADLESTLQLIGLDPAEYAPLLAPLVDIPLPPDRAANFLPEELRRRQLAAMTAWVLAGARSQPAVVVFEDLHWADPTSLDLMQALAERGAQVPLLILATARPEFRPPWSLRSHHGVISLRPLDRADVAQMVGELAARHALSKEVVDGVSERTGGVPLFVEEVTRLLLERGEAGGLQAIPPTLQQSLAARLDRLGEAREVAQIGAVLGRDFTYSLLSAVGGVDDTALEAALDRLAGADLLIAEGAGHEANYRFKHALIQDAAYDSLLKSRRQTLHRHAAELLRDQPERAAAEPEVIAHHFTQAGLDDLAIEWWGKAGDQALRRSAFQEAIAHLGKAIAMTDKAAGTGEPSAAAATASGGQRLKLQTSLGQAVMFSRGLGAEETKAVFARAQELAAGSEGAAERFVRYYGRWGVSLLRGDLALARATAETFLQEARREGGPPDIVAAGRMAGLACFQQGDFLEARSHFEEVLGIYDREWDGEAKYRHGMDSGICATAYLAHVIWYFGEVERARDLIEEAMRRAIDSGHIPTLANTYLFKSLLETIRDDAEPTLRDAEALVEIAGKHGLALYLATGSVIRGWARARLGDREAGVAELRHALAKWDEQGNRSTVPLFEGLLAGLDNEGESPAEAVTCIDGALSVAQQTGEHSADAFLHRIRGDILLKAKPENPASAEEAYLAAIAIAREQGARSFGLQAALKLAKLHQSTTRPVEAYAVLAPALEGFSPTPEMPEIAEAQALLANLARTDDVKAAAAQRQRLGQLHIAYGNALFAARGPTAPETRQAFARVREQGLGDHGAPEQLAADYGLWIASYLRGELPAMRAHASAFLVDVEARPDSGEAGVAHRAVGITHWFAGEYRQAREHLERALALFKPGRDDDLAIFFGQDTGVSAMANLAHSLWPLGEVDRAISLIERMLGRVADFAHVGTLAFARQQAAMFELIRGDSARAAENISELGRILREHDLPLFRAFYIFLHGWASGRLPDMRRAIDLLREQNVLWFDGLLRIVLAEAEAGQGDPERGIAVLDGAIATVERTGYRTFEAELHRERGEMLLRRDRADTASAERALLRAIAVARQQGTRSFGLRAALALAKLHQSTARPADAHDVLAPALDGFSPTPEMPEIAEAQALSGSLS